MAKKFSKAKVNYKKHERKVMNKQDRLDAVKATHGIWKDLSDKELKALTEEDELKKS